MQICAAPQSEARVWYFRMTFRHDRHDRLSQMFEIPSDVKFSPQTEVMCVT